jgi:uncharacterized coiled-coil DUF342 family protein
MEHLLAATQKVVELNNQNEQLRRELDEAKNELCKYQTDSEDDCFYNVRRLRRELAEALGEIEMVNIRYAAAQMYHSNNMEEITEQRDELLKAIEGYDTTAIEYPEWQRRIQKAIENCKEYK